jgi:uncharacterized OsmC-like protein
MGLKVEDIKAVATGQRQLDQHPTVLTSIVLSYEIKGPNLQAAVVEKAIQMAEDKYCPVLAMLKEQVEITWTFQLK